MQHLCLQEGEAAMRCSTFACMKKKNSHAIACAQQREGIGQHTSDFWHAAHLELVRHGRVIGRMQVASESCLSGDAHHK
eukprot:scaffold113525_cov19-Tisochrysis_lutea.AAC.1